MPSIQAGKYRHYKGNLYQVFGLVRHSETEEWLVHYQPLYQTAEAHSHWVRPLAMFTEMVETETGLKPRFELIED